MHEAFPRAGVVVLQHIGTLRHGGSAIRNAGATFHFAKQDVFLRTLHGNEARGSHHLN